MPATEILYTLSSESYGSGLKSQSDRWLKIRSSEFLVVYNASPNQGFEDISSYRFDSGKWAIIDEELKRLDIRHAESVSIQFKIIETQRASNVSP